MGGLLGANGGIYAIRQALYEPLPEDTLIDDFTVVMRIALGGAGVIYDESAIGYETVAPSIQDEYRRRVRIGAGNYQAFFRLGDALPPPPPAWHADIYLYLTQGAALVYTPSAGAGGLHVIGAGA